jgi:hypothetical protein
MHIPSGFFGMLFEWYEAGVEVMLYSPRQNIRQMLWFRMFFREDPHRNDIFRLTDADVRHHTSVEQEEYHRREFSAAWDSPDTALAVAESDDPEELWRSL